MAFSTGIASPVIMDSSTALLPSITIAVGRHGFARPHDQHIADMDLFQRHIFGAAFGLAPHGLGREIEQGADGRAGLRARAEFQNLAHQHQRHDHRGGFEIDRRGAASRRGRRSERWPGKSSTTTE